MLYVCGRLTIPHSEPVLCFVYNVRLLPNQRRASSSIQVLRLSIVLMGRNDSQPILGAAVFSCGQNTRGVERIQKLVRVVWSVVMVMELEAIIAGVRKNECGCFRYD